MTYGGDVQPGDSVVFDTDVGLLVTVAVRGQVLNVGDVVVVAHPYPTVTQDELDALGPYGMELDLQQVTKPYGQVDEELPYGRDRDHSQVCIFVRHIERDHEWHPDGYWLDEGHYQHAKAALFHLVVRTDNRQLAEMIVAGRLAGNGHPTTEALLVDLSDAAA